MRSCLGGAANGILSHIQVWKVNSSFCVPVTLTLWGSVSLAVEWVDNSSSSSSYYIYFLIFILYWSLVDLQCCVGFRGTAK